MPKQKGSTRRLRDENQPISKEKEVHLIRERENEAKRMEVREP